MGTLVDITTVKKEQNICYKITSGALRFQVRGAGYAGVGLKKKAKKDCDIWLVIGCQGFTWVSKGNSQVHSVATPDVISADEFREFWIKVFNDMISLGREHEKDPLISYRIKTFDLKYITFGVFRDNAYPLQWRFEVPPLQEKPKIKPVPGGYPQWEPADTQLPADALIGGFDKEMLYIIKAEHRGSVTPGKFVPSEGVGYISWGGGMHEKTEFEVLCGYDCIWVPCSCGMVPMGAVVGGYSEGHENEPLYVGRAKINNSIIPGKVQSSHKVCYIPHDDREIPMKNYEVLIVPHENMQRANIFSMCDLSMDSISSCDEDDDDNLHEEQHFALHLQ